VLNRKAKYFIFALIALLGFVPSAFPKNHKIISETIEWTWEVKPERPQAGLPNVLLVGDSITRNYFPAVRQALEAKANVYLFASSTCAGDPRLPAQLSEFFNMEGVPFRVIHFNNGMHGWGYTEAEYGSGVAELIHTLKSFARDAALIWANTTPVRKDNPEGATNARIKERNTIADDLARRNHIVLDDQHKLIEDSPAVYADDVHLDTKTSELQGEQAARLIEESLK